jgi:tetratricopeptide (TPR) repeat protein
MTDKKIPLKIICYLCVSALLLILSLLLAFKLSKNHEFVQAYDNAEYLTGNEEKIMVINIPESYLPYYNLGNVAYKNTEYNSAVGYYSKALSLFPVGQKECDVRINLALAMCNTIDFTHLESQEKIDTALIILYKARDVLLENGWASDVPEEARNADAQKLKEDIDEMIKKLENPDGGTNNQDDSDEPNPDEQDDSGNEQPSQSEREKRQQDQLERNKKNAMEERNYQQGQIENGDDGDGGGGYNPW